MREVYTTFIRANDYREDAAQRNVVDQFQRLCDDLRRQPPRRPGGWLRWFRPQPRQCAVPGLYLWGSTGRGKTWLMDLFVANVRSATVRREHFHPFMEGVHEQLSAIRKQRDPVKLLARQIAAQARVLCLDEFIVTNITDAMLLYALLQNLFAEGVVLVATSNRRPDDLYLNGLQRDRFLPAIALMKHCMDIHHVSGDTDHRYNLLSQHDLHYAPESAAVVAALEERFQALAPAAVQRDAELRIKHRAIPALRLADDIVWFRFDVICEAPRGAPDYEEIASRFHTVFITRIPILTPAHDAMVRRFMYLVDALYEHRVQLLLAAADVTGKLYHGAQLAFGFRRTVSRLEEMRSVRYLASAHRP